MSEKGILHTIRRKTLGRNAVEHESHERNLRKLKDDLNSITQSTVDDFNRRYDNDVVKKKVMSAAGKTGLNKFMEELKGLQVLLIESKKQFYTNRKEDEINDIEDVNHEVELWKKESDRLIEESDFRRMAGQYEVWGHEPVEHIQTGVHKKIIRIRPAA